MIDTNRTVLFFRDPEPPPAEDKVITAVDIYHPSMNQYSIVLHPKSGGLGHEIVLTASIYRMLQDAMAKQCDREHSRQ